MAKFRKIPVIIDAIRIKKEMTIDTLEGRMNGKAGDWLLTGVDGEQYPCKDSIFRKTYEPADEDAEKMWK